MLAFRKAIKVRTGQVAANAFMSDDAPAFFNAWKDVMGEPKHRLLCAWHVDKNWRENIKRHIRDANLQAFTYKALRTVLDSPNEDSFKDSLASFFAWCDLEGQNEEGLIKFKEYFRQHYANRPETWAACFRRNAGINTNMRLEALHKLLKYCYLDGQQNKRVDKLISVLLKLTRNKIFDRLIKLIKNAETESQRKVTERHNGGLKIAASRVSSAGIAQWTVQSQSQPATMYVVTSQSGGMCQESCSFACPRCRVCAHNTTCSCPDNELRRNLCKHIHAVFINKMDNTDEGQQPVEEDMQGCQPDLPTSQATPAAAPPLPKDCNSEREVEDAVASLVALNSIKETGTKNSQGRCTSMMQAISQYLQNPDPEDEVAPWLEPALGQILDKLSVAAGAYQHPVANTPSNKKIEKQLRFVSTKRKPKHAAPGKMAKPTIIEQKAVQDVLNAAGGSGGQHTAFDHTY
ncbi:hypothetical protein HPB48_007166 [Haemaphysalis longicornis]|uniref:SWIM-type domain-containing protein n=1 Tax=Haemaphysalis longicornis TaxID=44386 RepID=A0A9J6GU28_HAELO|nr:hypothetical protein HPB48_007166 [Haemaphysalis longicornis]